MNCGPKCTVCWYYFTCRKNPRRADLISTSDLFSPDTPVKPKIGVPKGKFESFDYESCENELNKEDAAFRGTKYLTTQNFKRYFLVVFTGALIGICGGTLFVFANMARCSYGYWLQKAFIDERDPLTGYISAAILIPICIAILGSLIVVYIEPNTAGGGVAQVMAAVNGVRMERLLNFRCLVVKWLSTMCMYASGLPGGKEGPMIHMGGIVASCVALMRVPFSSKRAFPFFSQDKERRELIICGVGAGLSAAFGTPLGGFLVAIEEYLNFWNSDLFIRIFLCTLTSSTMFCLIISLYRNLKASMGTDNMLFLEMYYEYSLFEFEFDDIPLFVLFGVLGGLLGALWIQTNYWFNKYVRKKIIIKWGPVRVLEVVFWTFVINGLLILFLYRTEFCSPYPREHFRTEKFQPACPVTEYTHDMKLGCPEGAPVFHTQAIFSLQPIDKTFEWMFDPNMEFIDIKPMFYNWIVYYVTSILFAGSAISAGLFIPNLTSGSFMGRLVGLIFNKLIPKSYVWAPPHRCALFGAATMLTGVTRLTFSVAVIMCEGSSNTVMLLPVFIVVAISRLVGDCFNVGIYELHLITGGFPIICRYPPPLGMGKTAKEVMSQEALVVLTTRTTVGKLFEVAFETRHNGFPVVESASTRGGEVSSYGHLSGMLIRSQILIILKNRWFESPAVPSDLRARTSVFRKDFADMIDKEQRARPRINMNESVDLSYIMDTCPTTIIYTASLNRTYRLFVAMTLRHLIVINNGYEVVGIITRKDLSPYRLKVTLRGIAVEMTPVAN